MTSRDFAYWFQGFFEIGDPKTITEAQLSIIRSHMRLVTYTKNMDKQSFKNNNNVRAKC